MTAIRVLLADDHPVVRAGLRAVLESEPGILVVDALPTAQAAVARARDGIEATGQIAALPSPPRVVVLTTYDTETDILAAVEAGAAGYLLKDAPPEDLIAAQLFVSQATIKSHLVHVLAKLDVDSRTAAVAAAVRRGLIRRPGP